MAETRDLRKTGRPPKAGPLSGANTRLLLGSSKHATVGTAKIRPELAQRGTPKYKPGPLTTTVTLRLRHRIVSAPACKRVLIKTGPNAGKYRYDPIEGTEINGEYGPGTLKVSPAIAAVLLEMERNALATIAAERTEKAVIIGPPRGGSNRLLEVPPEMFGEYMGMVQPWGAFR